MRWLFYWLCMIGGAIWLLATVGAAVTLLTSSPEAPNDILASDDPGVIVKVVAQILLGPAVAIPLWMLAKRIKSPRPRSRSRDKFVVHVLDEK